MMTDVLLEIFGEEIPARMQLQAATHYQNLWQEQLLEHRLTGEIQTFVTPQRLAILISKVPTHTPETIEEKRGPRLSAPQAALDGFLRSNQITADALTQKNDYWFYQKTITPQPVSEMLATMLQDVLRQMPWPKSMRWPQASHAWIRPIRRILCQVDATPLIFPITEFGIMTTSELVGHRFSDPHTFALPFAQDYVETLAHHGAVVNHITRRESIQHQLQSIAAQNQLTMDLDTPLLDELVGLTEHPTVFLGRIDPEFMTLPPPILSISMRVHQKYVPLKDSHGQMAPFFAGVANIAPQRMDIMIAGYERVLRARLSDAQFFWEQDLKSPLASFNDKLSQIIYHARLGTLQQKVQRLTHLMETEAGKTAAQLCKADLTTQVVREFPELQGTMGMLYAQKQGIALPIAQAIQEHYQPQGPIDTCPTQELSVHLALADKFDILVGFFAVGEAPTGSRDPYGLRRAALGIIRLIRENRLQDFNITHYLKKVYAAYHEQGMDLAQDTSMPLVHAFIIERLVHQLRTEGLRHDCIQAVLALEPLSPNILDMIIRIKLLNTYLNTPEGGALQAAFNRAHGILTEPATIQFLNSTEHIPPTVVFTEAAETQLAQALDAITQRRHAHAGAPDYADMIQWLATLHAPVEQFFTLRIHDSCETTRRRRLHLLQRLVDETCMIADLSQLEGVVTASQ